MSESGEVHLSHQEALESIHAELTSLARTDPLLNTLPVPFTLEEINSLVALENGQAMTVNVYRADDEIMPVIVEQTATVLDMKHAIQRYLTLKQSRENVKTKISWRYVWKTYSLFYDGQRLIDDHRKLKDYGIGNRDTVTFIKRFKEK